MFSIHKNSYLHNYYKDINPRLLNRSVQQAIDFLQIDEHCLEPPFNRLTSEQPNIPVKNVDVTRRPLGFGRVAMPKLRRELHDKHEEVVIAAIESICDLVHDPERGYEAINLRIVDRLVDLMSHENPAIREKTAKTLTVLAGLAQGKEAIVNNMFLLENISQSIEDPCPEVRIHVAAMLEMVARFWKAADELVEFGFITILLQNLLEEREEIAAIHLQTLASMMYGMKGKTLAMDNDAFSIFIELLDKTYEPILANTLECLSLLASTCIGEKIARDLDMLDLVKRFLYYEDVEVHTNAAAVIMFCTTRTTGKIAAARIKGLAKRLIHLSQSKLNPRTQIFAIKALTNICEHPDIRKEVRQKHISRVESIQLGGDPNIKSFKDTLQMVIGWAPANAT